tara:strand:+ start:197 stop:457 length:261 start_codon:yes stop_codon:yes gene_type:complete
MVKKMGDMKSDELYNHADNIVYIKGSGDFINVICNSEKQMDEVVKRMTTETCKLTGYEEWDEDEDKKWILRFIVCDSEYQLKPDYN